MEKLVIKSKAGSLYYNDTQKGVKLEPHEIIPHQRRLLLERLHAYEDTGLTPERIVELKERDTAKAVDNRTIIQNFSGAPLTLMGDCPSCGCENIKSCNTDFCPACGQRLKWEED